MAEKTAISWTDATFNPWWGCQKVSPACDNCYAERDAGRFASGRVLWGVGSERRTFEDKHWEAPGKWAKTMPAKLGRRPRVFCASMGDWLDLDAPLDQFVRLLDTIRLTPELDWLLLSKRVGNWRKRLLQAEAYIVAAGGDHGIVGHWLAGTPPANVWLGATVVDQAEADRDVPKLLQVPARVRFLSIEPMLGPIRLRLRGLCCDNGSLPGPGGVGGVMCPDCSGYGCTRLHWVIAGGESGPQARPMHPDWVRALRDECQDIGVPFHFKQWGEWGPVQLVVRPRGPLGPDSPDQVVWGTRFTKELPSGDRWEYILPVIRHGKKAAGRELDGVTHDAFPEVQR